MRLYLVFHIFQIISPFLYQVVCHLIRQYPRPCISAYEYFIFRGRVTSPSTKPPSLEDKCVFLSLVSLLWPVLLGRPYQEHVVPASIARKVIEACKPPTTRRWRNSWECDRIKLKITTVFINKLYSL